MLCPSWCDGWYLPDGVGRKSLSDVSCAKTAFLPAAPHRGTDSIMHTTRRAWWTVTAARAWLCRLALIAIGIALLTHGPEIAISDDTRAVPDVSADEIQVIEEFSVETNGDFLSLPVRLADGRTHNFIVDTGASGGVVDESLRGYLRESAGSVEVVGKGEMELYVLHAASVGKARMPLPRSVLCRDLSAFRQSGHDIRGIIGMDFLCRHAVQIDFERGRLRFLRRCRKAPGTELKLAYDEGCPVIEAQLGAGMTGKFILDTGMLTPASCGLRPEIVDELLARREFTLIGRPTNLLTAFGNESRRRGRLERLAFAGLEHRDILVNENAENILTLECISRYDVTFDFPNQRLFLSAREGRNDGPVRDMSGLSLKPNAGAPLVSDVEPRSAAARAGIAKGDQLLEVDGVPAGELTLSEVRKFLSIPGTRHHITTRRGVDTFEHHLALFNWRLKQPESPARSRRGRKGNEGSNK